MHSHITTIWEEKPVKFEFKASSLNTIKLSTNRIDFNICYFILSEKKTDYPIRTTFIFFSKNYNWSILPNRNDFDCANWEKAPKWITFSEAQYNRIAWIVLDNAMAFQWIRELFLLLFPLSIFGAFICVCVCVRDNRSAVHIRIVIRQALI